jgi:uncharacterized protein (TIGR00369 family)
METPSVQEQQQLVVGFDALYGLQVEAYGADEIRARVAIEDHHLQPAGLVHGGVLAAISESICSLGTAVAVWEQGMTALGMSNNTDFLAPLRTGHVHASARPRRRGRSVWVWDVELSDDDGRLCALTRMTIAVRPRRRDEELLSAL